jgi:glycerol-3-phosphate dehydrogenase (NAD(P)+)
VRDETVAVIGAGSWGTVVASLLAGQARTVLWSRREELAAAINGRHENPDYLPGIGLPKSLVATSSIEEAVGGAQAVLMAVPSHGFREVLRTVIPWLDPGAPVVSLAKGIEAGTNLRMSQIVADMAPHNPAGALSGPNLAMEIAETQPAATVVALPELRDAARIQSLLHTRSFRVYTGTDVVGCEISGATKNVMALAAGICDGLGFGENTRAVLITRGLAELGRLGVTLGGQSLTFGGLAGVGDLVATCTSPKSRNRTVGFELGRGRRLDEVVGGMRMVAEGVRTAGPLLALARANDVEMPIVEQIEAIVEGRRSPRDALVALMDRPARPEWDDEILSDFPG